MLDEQPADDREFADRVASFGMSDRFDPAEIVSLTDPYREVMLASILASGYAVAVIGVELARVLSEEAPAVRLMFRKIPTVTEDTGAMLSTVDGLLMPHGIISGLPAVELYKDRWTVVVATANPEVGDEITLEQLGVLPWVAYQRTYDAPVAKQLSMLGVEPRVQVSVDNFTLLHALVAGTRRIAMVQGLLAERLTRHLGVRVLECPFDAVPVQEAMWWHPVHTHDASHLWLRETITRVGAGIGPRG